MNSFSRQGKALPNEVQEKIIQNYLDSCSVTTVAAELNLPYKTVSNIIDVWLSRPNVEAKRGGNKIRTARTDEVVAFTEYVSKNKTTTYRKEIQQQLVTNAVCLPENIPSKSSVSRIMTKDLGYSYKKICPVARETEGDDVVEKLSIYIAAVSDIDTNRLHFFDESSVLVTSGNWNRGHSAIGQPAIEVQRYASNATYTVNLLHNVNRVSHYNIIRGPSNGLELLNFFDEALEHEDEFGNPIIKQDDVIVMDNCGFHHANHIEGNLRDVLQTRNVQLIFQPPYHPCYNMCKYCFNFMKVILRRYPKYTEKYTDLYCTGNDNNGFFKADF